MIQTEKQIKEDIVHLFIDLEAATYGRERANGHYLRPNAGTFYQRAKRIFELTDKLYESYHPDYIIETDYKSIFDAKKRFLLKIDVMKDQKHTNKMMLTYKLEEYLMIMKGLFKCIIK